MARAVPKPMPYEWVCSVCSSNNAPGTCSCDVCQSPAMLNAEEISQLRAKLGLPDPSLKKMPPTTVPWWAGELGFWGIVAWIIS
jgi:hypothetical protein